MRLHYRVCLSDSSLGITMFQAQKDRVGPLAQISDISSERARSWLANRRGDIQARWVTGT